MKKLALIILIVASSVTYENALAERWRMVIQNENITVYIDLDSITKKGGLVFVHQRETYVPPLRSIDSEMVSLVAYDCNKLQYALLYYAFLDQNGNITSGEDLRSQKWNFQSYEREGLFRLAPMNEGCGLAELPLEKRK